MDDIIAELVDEIYQSWWMRSSRVVDERYSREWMRSSRVITASDHANAKDATVLDSILSSDAVKSEGRQCSSVE